MAYRQEEALDEIFHALSDSTRREMIRMMVEKERTITELAAPFEMSLAAVSKHVKVLERAKVVHRSVNGRTHTCSLNGDMLAKASEWLRVYERYWTQRFDLLERELVKEEKSRESLHRRDRR